MDSNQFISDYYIDNDNNYNANNLISEDINNNVPYREDIIIDNPNFDSLENNDQNILDNNLNEENIHLKKQIDFLNNVLNNKNKEIEAINAKNDNNLVEINQAFDIHINEYQKLIDNYNIILKELESTNEKLLQETNKNDQLMQQINNYNNPNNFDENFINYLNGRIKNILNMLSLEEDNNNFDNINDELVNNIDKLEEQLINTKGQNYDIDYNINFYKKFIYLMNNFYNTNNSNNNLIPIQDNLPNYSINDSVPKKNNDILESINILINHIHFLNNNAFEPINIDNNNYNDKFHKLLKEMNQKNQQIKSLENIISKLTSNIKDNNNLNNSNLNQTNNTNSSFQGKIVNKKTYNLIKQNNATNNNNNMSNNMNIFSNKNFNSNELSDKFLKNEQKEKKLCAFLDKYTNGEFSDKYSENQNRKRFISDMSNNTANNNTIREKEQNVSNDSTDMFVAKQELNYLMEGKIQH